MQEEIYRFVLRSLNWRESSSLQAYDIATSERYGVTLPEESFEHSPQQIFPYKYPQLASEQT